MASAMEEKEDAIQQKEMEGIRPAISAPMKRS